METSATLGWFAHTASVAASTLMADAGGFSNCRHVSTRVGRLQGLPEKKKAISLQAQPSQMLVGMAGE
jgi:hypothetical protein